MHTNNLVFDVDLNVVNHLGVGLYSSTPAALTELVANAWDADAENVTITVDPINRTIVIEDDGHGMSIDDIKNKFLTVGYSRRKLSEKKDFSNSGHRRVMGRKGIGKLAMFALADHVKISSQFSGGNAIGFSIDVPNLRESLEQNNKMLLDEFEPAIFAKGHGTRIELSNVLKGLKTTEAFLRLKLARRFSVLGTAHNFLVKLNDKEITKLDRGFYDAVQFLWTLDEKTKDEISLLTTKLVKLPPKGTPDGQPEPCIELLSNSVQCGEDTFFVTGYIASVEKPKQLGGKEDSANILSVFANGRVFAEDVLSEANSSKYYQNYLVGEIHADFLDSDNIDRATASREAIKKDDPKYNALLVFIRTMLDSIGDKWDDWRSELGLDESEPQNAAVFDWIASLADPRDKKAATKLMTSIQNANLNSDDIKNSEAKKILVRGAVIGFEKLRLRNQLDKLDGITDVLSAEFAAIFTSLNHIEEASYSEITRQRLAVIQKFAKIKDDPSSLEKVAQNYLFEHLWLLDPTWGRLTSHVEKEKTLTKYLKDVQPDSSGARLDISYRSSAGRHIVIELKRPSLTSLNYYNLYEQVSKYKDAVEAYYRKELPNDPVPSLDIYVLVANTPSAFDEDKRKSLAAVNGQIITYTQLITDAQSAYQEYIDANITNGPIEKLLNLL